MFGWNTTSFDRSQSTRIPQGAGADLSDISFGLAAGTKVATQIGWRAVEAVAEGDMVLTFDGGLQTVVSITRTQVHADLAMTPEQAWPLFVPAGALGNREDMTLLPGQTVLIESDAAEEAFGDPFALIPAAALEGFRGITRVVPDGRMEIITLHFAQDEIVFANIGALFHCPRTGDLVADAMACTDQPYEVLGFEAAETLVTLLELEDAAAPARAAASGPGAVAAFSAAA